MNKKIGRPKRMEPIDKGFAERLIIARKSHKPKLTQAEIAERLQVNVDTVRNWEHGRVLPNNDRYYAALAKILNVEEHWLITGNTQEDILNQVKSVFDSFNQSGFRKDDPAWYYYKYPLHNSDLSQIKDIEKFNVYLDETVKNAITTYIKTIN